MDNYVKTFKYSTIDMIQCFCVTKEKLYTLTRGMLYIWDLNSKSLVLESEHEITANSCFLFEDNLYFLTKDALLNSEFNKVLDLKFSTVSIQIDKNLFLIDEEEIKICENLSKILSNQEEFNMKKMKHNLKSGLCTSAVLLDDSLFLSFENGKVFEIKTENLKPEEIKEKNFKEILDLKESIISMDRCHNKLAIGTVSQKLLVLKKKDYSYKFTKLTVEIKKICCRRREIFILDNKNNLLLFDDTLKIKGICSGVVDLDTSQEDIFMALEKKRILQLYDFSIYQIEKTSRVTV